LEVASALDDTPLELSDVSPEVTIGLRDATRFLKLHYPVHLSAAPEHPAPVGAYHVLLYRDPSNDVSTLELSELAAHVLGALRHGLPLARAAEHGLNAAGLPLTAENLADVANLLNELFTRRVLRRQPSSASN
jgi:hypothetical protein